MTALSQSQHYPSPLLSWIAKMKLNRFGLCCLLSLSSVSTFAMSSSAPNVPKAASVSAMSDRQIFDDAYDSLVGDVKQLDAPSAATQQFIRDTLKQAGLSIPIVSIVPSKLPSMYQVTLESIDGEKQPPLHITPDAQYVLQGELKPNPSPKIATPPKQRPSQMQKGMPISAALRDAMLQNMSALKNMTPQTSLYYTSIPGVIWGITLNGQPFITNTDASVFTDGEISLIDNHQFAGLDGDFEVAKNSYILSHLDEKNLIVYPATTNEKAVIYVATDINCPYCRVMHADMAALNAQGITVKVIGYPVYEASFEQMRQIWCHTDMAKRKQALDSAMQGHTVGAICANERINHLNDNRVLAAGLAVFATPAIYREDGVQFQATHKHPEFLHFLDIASD